MTLQNMLKRNSNKIRPHHEDGLTFYKLNATVTSFGFAATIIYCVMSLQRYAATTAWKAQALLAFKANETHGIPVGSVKLGRHYLQ